MTETENLRLRNGTAEFLAVDTPTHRLSKSAFMRGRQCPKSLWLYRHSPKLQDAVSAAQEAIFAQGTSVGRFAWGLFPGGIDLSPEYVDGIPRFAGALERTAEAVRSGADVLYEAAFVHKGVLAAVDILVRDGGRWRAYEVKSGASVKETYAEDAALQHWVLRGAGLDLTDVSVVHIDTSYVRSGAIDPRGLFAVASVHDFARDRSEAIGAEVARLEAVLAMDAVPDVAIGPHCSAPYPCSFHGHCWAHVPERSVFSLGRGGRKAWELWDRGVRTLAEIPDDFELNAAQRIEVACARTGKPHIDAKAVRGFLEPLGGELLFLDFETVGPAVPLFEGTRPFQAIPFQYSLHRRAARGGAFTHSAFLGDGRTDPREALVEQLLADTRGQAPILMYSPYERRVLGELSAAFPRRAKEIRNRMARLVDLITPFRRRAFYTPAMNGSSSIKKVLPAVAPELAYGDLDIADGSAANAAYESLHYDRDPARRERVRLALLDYCERDTLAMVKVLEALEAV